MSGERYVPNGVILICTNGASFGFFQVTFHVNTRIYASNMGTEGDRWPILNIPSFGACIATPNVPCMPSPVIWQQPRDGIYINSNQMLLENSTAKCMRGGTVSIQFTFANLQNSPSGSFKRPSEYIKDGFDWVFGKLDEGLADVRAGLADMGAPTWLQSGVDQLAWNVKASVGIVEGAINGVVGLGELIWDVANDPVGVGGAIVDSVCDGAKSALDWASDGSNWTNAANDAWDWASDGKNWEKAAGDAVQWLNDNPRTVGNVTGEVLLEVGAAVVTGGSSAVASGAKKVGTELVEEAVEQGVKKTLREGGQEVAEEAIEEAAKQQLKNNSPEVITRKTPRKPSYRHGSDDGGPGTWEHRKTPQKGSQYQEHVTGAPKDTEYVVKTNKMQSGEKKFDGYDPETKTLIDAKDWNKWPPAGQKWADDVVVSQAKKDAEIAAEAGCKLEYHVPNQEKANQLERIFRRENIDVDVVVTPK